MAGRILGMGDVVGLMKDFEGVVDQKKAEEDAARMLSGEFTLEDFLQQIRTIQQMGSLKDLVERLPGLGGMMPPGVDLDDKELVRIEAMIQSMTRYEKSDPNSLIREPSRTSRIARGSGCPEEAVKELVQKFLFMRQMMGGMGSEMGMLGKIPGLKNLAMARNVRRAMKSGKMPPGMQMPGMGMPGMGMPGMPPGMGFPGMGLPGGFGGEGGGSSVPRMRQLSKSEKNAKKNQRKRERDSRKKNRGK